MTVRMRKERIVQISRDKAQEGPENVEVTIYFHKASDDEEQTLCLIRRLKKKKKCRENGTMEIMCFT